MKLVPASVTRSFGRKVLVAKKNSPHIFFGMGLVGMLGSTVLACRATLKLEEAVDEIKVDLESVKAMEKTENYTDKDHYKDLGYVYGKSAARLGRLYGPSIILGGISIAALTGSHIQLSRRNTALTFTLAAVSKAFDDYRERVREEVGEERELEIHRAINSERVTVDGKKQLVKTVDQEGLSPYARLFDQNNPEWHNDSEWNRNFITAQQNYANTRLHAKGHVFLNEVYDWLGFERSVEGSVVGWVRDGNGDGYVDYGIFEFASNFNEKAILLDFNVDGVIYDKI